MVGRGSRIPLGRVREIWTNDSLISVQVAACNLLLRSDWDGATPARLPDKAISRTFGIRALFLARSATGPTFALFHPIRRVPEIRGSHGGSWTLRRGSDRHVRADFLGLDLLRALLGTRLVEPPSCAAPQFQRASAGQTSASRENTKNAACNGQCHFTQRS